MNKQAQEINARNWKFVVSFVSVGVVLCLLGGLAYVLLGAAGLI